MKQSLNLASDITETIADNLHRKKEIKQEAPKQARQGVSQLKSVKESQALPLPSQEIGHQAMGKQAREVVSNSTTLGLVEDDGYCWCTIFIEISSELEISCGCYY